MAIIENGNNRKRKFVERIREQLTYIQNGQFSTTQPTFQLNITVDKMGLTRNKRSW